MNTNRQDEPMKELEAEHEAQAAGRAIREVPGGSHTPGPWVWKHYENLDCYRLVAIGDYGFHPNGDKVEPQIHSDGSACGEYGADIDVHGPDALLIAAAPTMLKALQDIVKHQEVIGGRMSYRSAVSLIAMNAIAAAHGAKA